ncbi:MAG: type II toxin-antitoxin system RelE/ParE family toxin [Candidatus Dormibacteria bacterium]
MWEVEYTDLFGAWWATLSETEQERVAAAVEALEGHGPSMGRPFVDVIQGSRHANMKELRPRGGRLRVLFAFDPRRTAILLIGGDKTGKWDTWYREMIPVADELYDEHIALVTEEGVQS